MKISTEPTPTPAALKDPPSGMHKKKHSIIGLFWLIGAIIFFLPMIFSWYTQQQQKDDMVKFNKQMESSAPAKAAYNNFNKFVYEYQGKVSTNAIKAEAKKAGIKSGDIMGQLDIPAIKLYGQPIAYSDDYSTLAKGLGTLPFTSLPIGGKNTLSAITGHSGMANQIFFDNIKFLKKGDIIHTTVYGVKYSYQVTSKKTIDPDTLDADRNFFVTPGKDKISLMTCTPIFINSHRLIVYAKRIPNKIAKQKAVPYRAFWSIEHIYFIVVGLILLIIFLAIHHVTKKNRNK